MPLTSTLGTPSALYRKLDREAYRAFHAKSKLHKADHFFNFCVTAHSMRDFCLEHQQKFTRADKQPFHDLWNQQPFLVATREIANSSKHFVLRSCKTGGVTSPSTKAVRMGSAKYITVYRQNNALLYGEPYTRSEVRVELSDGRVLPLYEFTGEVLKYWRDYLASLGIKVRRVSLRSHGAA